LVGFCKKYAKIGRLYKGRLYKTFWEIIVGLQTGGKLEPQNRWEMKHWALEQVGDWKLVPKISV